jgi:anti-sigma-K factor RskA
VKRDLTHDEAVELIADAALDALPPDEQETVLAHAASCAQCGPTLATLRDAISQLAFAVPQVADDPVRRARVRTRLLARARADLSVADGAGMDAGRGPGRAGTGGPAVAPAALTAGADSARRPWLASPALGWGLALAAGLVGILAVNRRATMDDERLNQERTVLTARIDALRDSIAARDAFVSAVTGKQISSMQLTSGAVRAPWAWMFWDHATNRWTLVARDMAAPAPGKTYQLWLVTPRAKISAGTFDPKPDGSAEVQATYALAADSLRALAVTEEPAGGVPQPTGAIIFSATANRPGQ